MLQAVAGAFILPRDFKVGEGDLQGSTMGLARRYATALYELADQKKKLDVIADQLKTVRTYIAQSADLQRLIRHPLLKRQDQAKAMEALLNKAQMEELLRKFVGVIAANRRLSLLPAMINEFLALLAKARGEITAEVTSAIALNAEQQSRLVETLQRSQGGKVAIDVKVDPELLGGMIVRLGSRMIDASLRTKLNKLQFVMKGM